MLWERERERERDRVRPKTNDYNHVEHVGAHESQPAKHESISMFWSDIGVDVSSVCVCLYVEWVCVFL